MDAVLQICEQGWPTIALDPFLQLCPYQVDAIQVRAFQGSLPPVDAIFLHTQLSSPQGVFGVVILLEAMPSMLLKVCSIYFCILSSSPAEPAAGAPGIVNAGRTKYDLCTFS